MSTPAASAPAPAAAAAGSGAGDEDGLARLLALPELQGCLALWQAAEAEERAGPGRRPLAALFREAFCHAVLEALPEGSQHLLEHRGAVVSLVERGVQGCEAHRLGDPAARLELLRQADRRANGLLALVLEDWPVQQTSEVASGLNCAGQPKCDLEVWVRFGQLGIAGLCASTAAAQAYFTLLQCPCNAALLHNLGETLGLVQEKSVWAAEWGAFFRAASRVKGFCLRYTRCQELHEREADLESRGKHPKRGEALGNAKMLYELEQGVERAARFKVKQLAPQPPRDLQDDPEGLEAMASYKPGPEDQRRAALPGGDLAPAGRAAVVAMLRDEYTVLRLHPTGQVHDWRAKELHIDSKPFY